MFTVCMYVWRLCKCYSLQHAHSEMGRCRAWIRLAVNECALENYIGVLCQDDSLLKYVC